MGLVRREKGAYEHRMPPWLLGLCKRATYVCTRGEVEGDWRVTLVFANGLFDHCVYVDDRDEPHFISKVGKRYFEIKEV